MLILCTAVQVTKHLLLATVERLDSQRLDVDDRRLKSPRQYVHRGRVVPQQQGRLDGAHVHGAEHLTVRTTRYVVLFPVLTGCENVRC